MTQFWGNTFVSRRLSYTQFRRLNATQHVYLHDRVNEYIADSIIERSFPDIQTFISQQAFNGVQLFRNTAISILTASDTYPVLLLCRTS